MLMLMSFRVVLVMLVTNLGISSKLFFGGVKCKSSFLPVYWPTHRFFFQLSINIAPGELIQTVFILLSIHSCMTLWSHNFESYFSLDYNCTKTASIYHYLYTINLNTPRYLQEYLSVNRKHGVDLTPFSKVCLCHF